MPLSSLTAAPAAGLAFYLLPFVLVYWQVVNGKDLSLNHLLGNHELKLLLGKPLTYF
jgi:hypothetical protein